MKKPLLSLLKADLSFINQQKSRVGRMAGLASVLSPSFICTVLYRLSHSLVLMHIPVLPRLIWWINFLLFKVDIDQRARLYCALYMPHPTGIVIGQGTRINGHAKIMQGVTMGGNLGQTKKINGGISSQPHVNGRIFIGINAIVVGPIELHGHLFISPNTIVAKDIEQDGWVTSKDIRTLSDAHKHELGL
jgi:serine acetyltransferase